MARLRIGVLPLLVLGVAVYGLDRWITNRLEFGTVGDVLRSRIPSPEGTHLAELVELKSDDEVQHAYSIRVDGREGALVYWPVRGNGQFGVDMGWRNDRTLEIAFDHAGFVNQTLLPGLKIRVQGQIETP